jgi:hypothetical protein
MAGSLPAAGPAIAKLVDSGYSKQGVGAVSWHRSAGPARRTCVNSSCCAVFFFSSGGPATLQQSAYIVILCRAESRRKQAATPSFSGVVANCVPCSSPRLLPRLGTTCDAEGELPIDINYQKLAEWLVSGMASSGWPSRRFVGLGRGCCMQEERKKQPQQHRSSGVRCAASPCQTRPPDNTHPPCHVSPAALGR